MGQKINPIGFRLGIIRGWDSNWYGGKDYGDKLVEDEKIRKYLTVRIPKGGIAKVIIERTLKRITLTINTSRPGIVIGKGGQEVDAIREEIKKITGKDVQININEINIALPRKAPVSACSSCSPAIFTVIPSGKPKRSTAFFTFGTTSFPLKPVNTFEETVTMRV